MMKPPNVVNVYPLEPDTSINPLGDRSVITLPDSWTKYVIVFNVEVDREDDIMRINKDWQKQLRIEVNNLVKKGFPIVIIANDNGDFEKMIREYVYEKDLNLMMFIKSRRARFQHKA